MKNIEEETPSTFVQTTTQKRKRTGMNIIVNNVPTRGIAVLILVVGFGMENPYDVDIFKNIICTCKFLSIHATKNNLCSVVLKKCWGEKKFEQKLVHPPMEKSPRYSVWEDTLFFVKDGKKNGPFKSSRRWGGKDVESRPRIDCFYVNDLLDGRYVEYYADYALCILQNYKNGELHGLSLDYYGDKEHKLANETLYKDGKKHGEHRNFWTDGKLCWIINYENDEKHGKYQYFSKDGTIEKIENYEHGQKHGKCIYINNSTREKRIQIYDHGELFIEEEIVKIE